RPPGDRVPGVRDRVSPRHPRQPARQPRQRRRLCASRGRVRAQRRFIARERRPGRANLSGDVSAVGATMFKEFKTFINQGSAIDLAVGVIIGAAFGKIVNSLVNDVIMPVFGLILGKVSFTDLYWALNGQTYASLDAAKKAGAPVIAYGVFLNTIVEFLIVAF